MADTLHVRRRIGDVETPVGTLLKLGPNRPGTFLFESIVGGHRLGRYSFIGHDPLTWFRVQGGVAETSADAEFTGAQPHPSPTPVGALRAFAEAAKIDGPSSDGLPPMASGAFGYLGYDFIQHVEPVRFAARDVLGVPDALLVIPKLVIIFDHLHQEILLVARARAGDEASANTYLDAIERQLDAPSPMPPRFSEASAAVDFVSNATPQAYFDHVDRAKAYIRAGDIFQVVPSQRLSAPSPAKSVSVYRALRQLNPSAFMFHMHLGAVQLVGSSPEILVRVRGGRVAIRPIAGTRPRSGDPVEDAKRASDLLEDAKEMAEHLMLLDLGRNDVGRVAAYGSVEVTERFVIERYSHVMHIVSHVEGDLRDGLTAVDALLAGFPAGTVTGAPKIRAMQIIDELEGERRGIYGGAVGYFGWNGDMDTCIALRTAVIKDGQLHLQAGGGVVLDSDPQYEFDETLHKIGALRRASEMAPKFEHGQ
ncbi:MAG: anthranilate synthase component I [Pseudomonadota bacterium]